MAISSSVKASLDMDDLEFLDHGSATLMVLLPDGSVVHIPNIDSLKILDTCPLLFHAFEFRESAYVQQASIEATSRSAVVSLLRFLYTGTYLVDHHEHPAFLPHAEAFKIAQDFDVPELQIQAYVNFTRETESACCRPTPPSDMCATIQFLYRHLVGTSSREYQSLLDTLLHYCVSVFVYQSLGVHPDFRQTVFNNPDFHRDLCRINLERDFDADGASGIMQLPVCRPTPHSQALLFNRAIGDIQYEILQEDGEPALATDNLEAGSNSTKKRKTSYGSFTLVHRPKVRHGNPSCYSSESEADSSSDGYSVVYRPQDYLAPKPLEYESEFESSRTSQGYHAIRLSDFDRLHKPEATSSSFPCETLSTVPISCPRPAVVADSVSRDESRRSISDSEWDFV